MGAAAPGVAVPPDREAPPVRRLGTGPLAREALADGRLAGDRTTVALASPGVSGMPRFAVLAARGFQALLSAPRQAQRAPGRPTRAPRAGPWRQRRQASGVLAGAWRPDDPVGVLRAAWRQRPSTAWLR